MIYGCSKRARKLILMTLNAAGEVEPSNQDLEESSDVDDYGMDPYESD